jgi:hypothetical protein
VSLINEARVEKALTYLSDTDFECANAKVSAERWKYVAKRNRAISILASEKGWTAQIKEAKAENSQEVIDAENQYFAQLENYEQMSAKRKTEQLVIEVWRTEQANLRKG